MVGLGSMPVSPSLACGMLPQRDIAVCLYMTFTAAPAVETVDWLGCLLLE